MGRNPCITLEKTSENILKARTLYRAGYSVAEICKVMGYSDSYVRVLLRGGTKSYQAQLAKRKPKIEYERAPMKSEDPDVSFADIYQGPKTVTVDEAYANIACAITQQACKDYVHALNIIQQCALEQDVCFICRGTAKVKSDKDPCQTDRKGCNCRVFQARRMKAECEDFFANRAHNFTPNISGAFITNKLKERCNFNDEQYEAYKASFGFKF